MTEIIEFRAETKGETILAHVRRYMPGELSWSAARKIIGHRRVAIGGVPCFDEARRLSPGEVIQVHERSLRPSPDDSDVEVLFVDTEMIVVEKPPGMISIRPKTEKDWSSQRRNLHPTLDECVARLVGDHAAKRKSDRRRRNRMPKLFPVHRLDRDASGLMVFARTKEAQLHLIEQFSSREALRIYLAIIAGRIEPSLEEFDVTSTLVKDRGDGVRGSGADDSEDGKWARTHFRSLRASSNYTELLCRLETGRTNQIRIHLAEQYQPICGDRKYRGPYNKNLAEGEGRGHELDSSVLSELSRLALHSAVLELDHPQTGKRLRFEKDWPLDIEPFVKESFVGRERESSPVHDAE